MHCTSHCTPLSTAKACPSAQEDLRRALGLLPVATWAAAAALARELDAAGPLRPGRGLRTRGPGVALADDLGLHEPVPLDTALRACGVPMALGWEQLARAPGLRSRLGLIRWELFPTRHFMRVWSPRAARGRSGMAAARVERLAWLLRHALPGLRAWHRSRRRSRR